MNKRHWLTAILDDAKADFVFEKIHESYRLVSN